MRQDKALTVLLDWPLSLTKKYKPLPKLIKINSIMVKIKMVAILGIFMKKLQIRLGQWTFSPGWASSLSTVILLPLLVYLGFWQLGRFQEKNQMQTELEYRILESTISFGSFPEIKSLTDRESNPSNEINRKEVFLKQFRYRTLQMEGQFLNDRQLLLDNQISEGKLGYRVLTPFQPKDSKKIILIDRGFIPLGKNREDIPPITITNEVISLKGFITQPSHGLKLKRADSLEQIRWPLKVQYIDYERLLKDFSLDFYPFIVQIQSDSPLAYWVTLPTFKNSSHRHLGYAIQWFAMAIAVLIYYGIINGRRFKNAKSF